MGTDFPIQGALRLSASAGSGKTYSLTQLYIKKALTSTGAFRGMVAITFTNKAAAELKERIMQKLSELSTEEKITKRDLEDLGFESESNLAMQATSLLTCILHDFDSFQVATIDSFFQTIFSQLAYEFKLPHGLQPDLDQNLIKAEVLELGMRQLDPETKQVLLENVMDIVAENGKGWRPSRYIETELLDNLFQEKVVDFQLLASEEMLSGASILKAREKLKTYAGNEKKTIQNAAQKVLDTCNMLGYGPLQLDPVEDKTFLDELTKIKKTADGTALSLPSGTQQKGEFYRKPKSKKFTEEAMNQIGIVLNEFASVVCERNLANLNLSIGLSKHLSSIRLLVYFRNILQQRNEKANRYLLHEVKYILKKFNGDSDVPYLYERLGNQIHTLMIDEFQDTDQVQWQVILPLAKAILDAGGFFVVVGDVKQSIYGWRGADSTLFKNGVDKGLIPNIVKEESLPFNYRSEARIIGFNNWIFGKMATLLSDYVVKSESAAQSEKWAETFARNYEDQLQQVPENRQKADVEGFVDFRVRKKVKKSELDENEENSGSFDWIIEEVKRLQNEGIKASEIGILVRSNRHLTEVVSLLDQARQTESEYDFSYSSAAEMTQATHPVNVFLSLAMEMCLQPSDFQFRNMETLAKTLELNEKFWKKEPGLHPKWQIEWKSAEHIEKMKQLTLQDRLKEILITFQFDRTEKHDYVITQFKNLIYKYIQNESGRYPDFTTWWKNKSGKEKLTLPDQKQGIQVMTIHKSKGLDFGVVILVIDSNSTGDSLHKFTFWPASEEEPWNAYPLLKTAAKREFGQSDLSIQYDENIYSQVLENLNTWYVAFTRPRFGLIVDITLDTDLEEPKNTPTKWARISFAMPYLLKENEVNLSGDFPQSTFESDETFMLRFRNGSIAKIQEKKKPLLLTLLRSKPEIGRTSETPWASLKTDDAEQLTGELMHLLLEKMTRVNQWEQTFIRLSKSDTSHSAVWPVVGENLKQFFKDPQIMEWFSDAYESHPEQEMMDKAGKMYRADRILTNENEVIILDFKSGISLETHTIQIKNYAEIVSLSLKKPAKAYLIYFTPLQIIEI